MCCPFTVSIAEARELVGSELEDALCCLQQMGIIERFEITSEEVRVWQNADHRLDVFFYSSEKAVAIVNTSGGKNGKKE